MLVATAVSLVNDARHNGTEAEHPTPGKNRTLPSAMATAVAEKVFRPLVYRDETLVDMENTIEIATFQAFQVAYQREPKDRAELKQFYEDSV